MSYLMSDLGFKRFKTEIIFTIPLFLLHFYPERFEPSSRTTLIGEQPNPWDLLQPQDVMSRHRGAKPRRRYELLGAISLLSPG